MCGWVCTLAVCVCLLSQGWYLDNQATSWLKIEKTNSTSQSHISEPRAETADLQNESFGVSFYDCHRFCHWWDLFDFVLFLIIYINRWKIGPYAAGSLVARMINSTPNGTGFESPWPETAWRPPWARWITPSCTLMTCISIQCMSFQIIDHLIILSFNTVMSCIAPLNMHCSHHLRSQRRNA